MAAIPPATAQPAPLALDHVYALVARRSPRVQAAAALARAAEARVPGASLPPDPELQLGFMNYMLPDVRPDPALGMTQLQLMQMVPLPGKLAAAGRAAGARAEAAGSRAADVAWEARAAAAMLFYERYELEGRVAIALETRRLLEDVSSVASAMYRVGEGRQADVLRARDEEVERMRTMTEGATARLAAAADVPFDSMAGSPVLPDFPDSVPSREALQRLALEARPMLAAGAAGVRAARADAALARRELWPDLEVGVQYGQRRVEMGTDRMGSLMIGASLPIFARSRQLQMREEAAAMEAMATAELESMRAETRGRVAAAHAELLSARRLAALYRTTVLPQAEAATASALASYRTGGVDFMTVVDNRMGVNQYRQELLALEAAEGRAWAELEMLVGHPLAPTDPSAAVAPRATEGARR
ncbi:MAG: TolC family protein [Gemmatimonadaceae bacterium]